MVCLTELLLTCSQPYVDTASVNLNYTTYEGLRLSNGVNAFLGVRYAAPPVGDLRWRAPVDPARVETGTVESAMAVSHTSICLLQLKTLAKRTAIVRPGMPQH
jgi:carboxylesterase type B